MKKRCDEAEFRASFRLEQRARMAVLRVLPSEGLVFSDPQQMALFWQLFEGLDHSKTKVLAIVVSRGVLSSSNVDRFWEQTGGLSDLPASEGRDLPSFMAREVGPLRVEIALSRFVSAVMKTQILVLVALQGEILFPFLGPALACDYRVASTDTLFVNGCVEAGFPPLGALPWFLPRFVGQGKASELIIEREALPAKEALELGLVHCLASSGNLEEEAISRGEWLASRDTAGLLATKRMLSLASEELETFLQRENEAFTRCLHSRIGKLGHGRAGPSASVSPWRTS